MPSSQTDEIKSKLNIEDVISSYIHLTKAGNNLKALCPFHNEKTPSFMVSPERNIWHCFGCGEGGDIFTFIMKIEGLEFIDALKLLAEKANVNLENLSYSNTGRKSKIFEIIEVSRKFYQKCLETKFGEKVVQYLKKRGVSESIIEKFQLGYAPDSWDITNNFLRKRGYKENEIFEAGMTVKKENGGYYDRFRNRIMFPINNISGQTVGFGSRVMPQENKSKAKYINTPETPVYNKSKILYGLDKSKVFIRTKDLCIIVEGNMDLIASFQAGVENVVAVSGTSLTESQLKIIKRYTNNIAFSFDVDAAGIKAAGRGIELALTEGMNVGIIKIPEGKDPADCVKNNPGLWRRAVKNQKQVMEFYFDSVFSKYDSSNVENKKKIAAELLEIISKISNKIEQSHYLRILSEKLDIKEEVIFSILSEIKKEKFEIKRFNGKFAKENKILTENERKNRLQEKILGFIIVYPQLFEKFFYEISELFSNKKLKKIYDAIKTAYIKNGKLNLEILENLKSHLSKNKKSEFYLNEELSSIWDKIAFKTEAGVDTDIKENFLDEAKFCVNALRKMKLRESLKEIETDIKNAEKSKDYENHKLLIEEFNKLVIELNKLENYENKKNN